MTLLMITLYLPFVKTDLDPLVHILTKNLKTLPHGFITIT